MDNLLFEELSLRDYVSVLFKRKYIILTVFVVAVTMTALYSYLVMPKYDATAEVLLTAEKDNPVSKSKKLSPFRIGVEIGATQTQIIRSDTIISEVVRALELDKRPRPTGFRGTIQNKLEDMIIKYRELKVGVKKYLSSLIFGKTPGTKREASDFEKAAKNLKNKKNVRIKLVERTDVISITVRDVDPMMAAKIANTFAQIYIIYNLGLNRADLLETYRPQHPLVAEVDDEIKRLRSGVKEGKVHTFEDINGQAKIGTVKLLQPATVPLKPVFPFKKLNMIAASVLSLMFGIAMVFMFEVFDQSLKLPKDVSTMLKTKCLGSVPFTKIKNRVFSPDEKAAERNAYGIAIMDTAVQLFRLIKEKNLKSIMLVSPDAKEGKTLLAFNLANAISQLLGEQVLVMDANLRGPGIHKLIGKKNNAGLTEILQEKSELNDVLYSAPRAKIDAIFSGQLVSYPEVLLVSEKNQKVISSIIGKYAFTIIDTPALNHFKDALHFAPLTDGAVFVIKTCRTRKHSAVAASFALKDAGIPAIGAVLNFREYKIPTAIYKRL